MSQAELGGHIGVTFQQVQKYEKGANRVGAGRLQRIAEALNVSVSFFFDGGAQAAPQDKKSESMFGYLRSRKTVRMLKAFERIKNVKVRASLIALAEHLAERA